MTTVSSLVSLVQKLEISPWAKLCSSEVLGYNESLKFSW